MAFISVQNLADIRSFPRCFFPSKSCIFVFTIATIFARDSRQQYPFIVTQVQIHAKYPLFDSQSDRGFTFSYAIMAHVSRYFCPKGNLSSSTNVLPSLQQTRVAYLSRVHQTTWKKCFYCSLLVGI